MAKTKYVYVIICECSANAAYTNATALHKALLRYSGSDNENDIPSLSKLRKEIKKAHNDDRCYRDVFGANDRYGSAIYVCEVPIKSV